MVRFTGLVTVFAPGFGTSMLISQGVTKTERFPQFENDEVKVWKTVVQRLPACLPLPYPIQTRRAESALPDSPQPLRHRTRRCQ